MVLESSGDNNKCSTQYLQEFARAKYYTDYIISEMNIES